MIKRKKEEEKEIEEKEENINKENGRLDGRRRGK
jgi:hypothetical protein